MLLVNPPTTTHIKTNKELADKINTGDDSFNFGPHTTAFPEKSLNQTEWNTIRTLDLFYEVRNACTIAAQQPTSKERIPKVKVTVNGVEFSVPADADNHTALQAYQVAAIDYQESDMAHNRYHIKPVPSGMLEDTVYTACLVAKLRGVDAQVYFRFEHPGRKPFPVIPEEDPINNNETFRVEHGWDPELVLDYIMKVRREADQS